MQFCFIGVVKIPRGMASCPDPYNAAWPPDIGVARILSGGALFLAKKVDDLFFYFLVVALKDRLNIPPNLTRPAKTVEK